MESGKQVLGRHTQTPLNHTAPFFLPFVKDPFGALRPPLTLEALRLSLELAATSYDFDFSQWLVAGWTDVSVQAETRLYTGMRRVSFMQNRKAYVHNAWSLYRSRRNAKSTDPITQLRGALRQRKNPDSGKALVMAKKHADGKYLIAMGFMGTGARIYDWFSNFRMTSQEGFHKGFLQLARQMEANEGKIIFPDLALELGLEKLTLSNILDECRHKDSRFCLWLAGHSQGGAVLQVYAHLKLHGDGILPENIVGYGFASPSAALLSPGMIPCAYPIYHLLNSDDLVPRMGSRVHLGMMLTYPSGDVLRKAAYGWSAEDASFQNRIKLRRIMRCMVDTPSCIEAGMAYFQMLFSRSMEDIHKALSEWQMKYLPIKQMLMIADKRDADVLRFILRRAQAAYLDMTGRELDKEKLQTIRNQMEEAVNEIGMGPFSAALTQWMTRPHSLIKRDAAAMGTYEYIAMRGHDSLHASIWERGEEPIRRWAQSVGGGGEAGAPDAIRARRSPKTGVPRRTYRGNRFRYHPSRRR